MRPIRIVYWLPLTLMILLAGISYWLVQLNLTSVEEPPPRPKAHRPDYFADDFSITILDQAGAMRYQLKAAKLLHYEDDSHTEVKLPIIHAFMPGQPEVTSFAQQGTMNSDGSIIDLYGDAHLLRAPGKSDPAMQAVSQHFRLFVNDDMMQTQQPIKLQRDQSLVTAEGMIYNHATRVMQLIGQVRGLITESEPIQKFMTPPRSK